MVTEDVAVSLDDGTELRPAAYHRLARTLNASAEPKQHVHILGSFSTQFLEPLVLVEAYRLGLSTELTLAPFGQLEQELHDTTSAMWRTNTRAVVVLFRPEDVDPELYRAPRGSALEERLQRLEERVVT